jgi:hypothetical protein
LCYIPHWDELTQLMYRGCRELAIFSFSPDNSSAVGCGLWQKMLEH